MNKRERRNTILFTGGGSGGHVYPGLAVIGELESRGFFADKQLFWIGSSRGMEKGIVEQAGIEFLSVPAGKLRRYFSFRNFLDIFNLMYALFKSLALMLGKKPALLFSKGGYVSVPPVIAARICGVPVLTHESDLDPGLATRINAKFADSICLSYSGTAEYFSSLLQPKLVVTGNPIRSAILTGDPARGRKLFGFSGEKPLVLVIGGSLGAAQINSLLQEVYPYILPDAVILHQTGSGNGEGQPAAGYIQQEYIHSEMADVLAAADLVITRAGAGTLWECGTLGKAMILIPLDTAGSRGDQLRNAALFADNGAARVLEGGSATAENLKNTVLELLNDPEKRSRIGGAARRITEKSGAVECADLIETALKPDMSR